MEKLLVDADDCYHDLAESRASLRDLDADKFNIFTLTGRATFEVSTHQSILADLLNPLGTHQQGNFLLKPFLDKITRTTGIPFAPANGLWEVDQKYHIDVRIRHPNSGDRVIIETKWNAQDYEGQVDGYWCAERERAPRRQRIPTVFLTKTGRRPKILVEGTERVLFEKDLVVLSYRDDIAGMSGTRTRMCEGTSRARGATSVPRSAEGHTQRRGRRA